MEQDKFDSFGEVGKKLPGFMGIIANLLNQSDASVFNFWIPTIWTLICYILNDAIKQ